MDCLIASVLLILLVALIVWGGISNRRFDQEMEKHFREEQIIDLISEWLVASRQRIDGAIEVAPKSTPTKSSAPVITREALAQCGLEASEISGLMSDYSVKVTEKLLRKWAAGGLNLYRLIDLLDGPAQAAFDRVGREIMRIYWEEWGRLLKARERPWNTVHEGEKEAYRYARQKYEETHSSWNPPSERDLEKAARPYTLRYKEALALSDRILKRVEILLQRERDVALAAAFWRAMILDFGSTVRPESSEH